MLMGRIAIFGEALEVTFCQDILRGVKLLLQWLVREVTAFLVDVSLSRSLGTARLSAYLKCAYHPYASP